MEKWVDLTTRLEPIWPDLAPDLTLLKEGFQGVAESQDDEQFLAAYLAVCDAERLDAADKVGARAATWTANAKAQGFDKKPDTARGVELLDTAAAGLINLRPHCRQLQDAIESQQAALQQGQSPSAGSSMWSSLGLVLGTLVEAAGAYEGARQQQLQQTQQQMMQMPMRCTSYQVGMYTDANCN